MQPDETTPVLPPRRADGHKGTFGTVVVVGGQAQAPRVMLGGPAFSALGALRAGAGLAVLAVPAPLLAHALAVAPSATGLALPVDEDGAIRASAAAALLDRALDRAQALVLGPGLGEGDAQQTLVLRMLSLESPPMVVDADALNAIAAAPIPQLDLRATAVLTPHPGEYQRLAAALGIAADPIDPAAGPLIVSRALPRKRPRIPPTMAVITPAR